MPGFITVVVTSFAAGILILVYRFVCVWENRKRDLSGTAEGYENAYQDDLTDKTVSTFIIIQESDVLQVLPLFFSYPPAIS